MTGSGTGFDTDDKLFINHTLLVCEAVIIGHRILGIDSTALTAHPGQVLDGAMFRDAGISNVIDTGFFDWVTSVEGGEHFLLTLIRRIDAFDWSDVEHDVLKVLYESVINADTRRHMGEYYTPDWLAQGIVATTVNDPLAQKVLDPACGSGTFVLCAVRHYIQAAQEAGKDTAGIVSGAVKHVWGMDIHPVSVLMARITYLMALGDLVREPGRPEFAVPIWMGDSVQWSQNTDNPGYGLHIDVNAEDLVQGSNGLQDSLFDVAGEEILDFPIENIHDANQFDQLVTDLTDQAKRHTPDSNKRPSVAEILKKFRLYGAPAGKTLTSTFHLLCDLYAQGRDTIWGFYVRNQARPLWLTRPGSQPDVLVGNPPWVKYSVMTADMQARYQQFAKARHLWTGGKNSTSQNLVDLFIVRACELYLPPEGGKFGFVTPQALLTRKQYTGFRAGKWSGRRRCEFTDLWDLAGITPSGFFPVPGGVVFGTTRECDDATTFPFPDTALHLEGVRSKKGWQATLAQVQQTRLPLTALSDKDEPASPYGEYSFQGATIVPRFLFMVTEKQANSALGQAATLMSVESARSTQEKAPWKDQDSLSGSVPRRFVKKVHLGSTITPFRALEPELAVLPIDKHTLLTEAEISAQDRGIREWWASATDMWEAHKTDTARKNNLTLRGRLNYQRGITQQLQNRAPLRLVYSKAGNTLTAAIIDDDAAIIDHKLYWMRLNSMDEGHYLSAILNAPAFTQAVSVYQSEGLFGKRDFDKYVWYLPIPMYDPDQPLHAELVELGKQAAKVAAQVDLDPGLYFTKARALIRDALTNAGISIRLDQAVTDLLHLDAN